MPRNTPIAVATAKLAHHEAHRAWQLLGGAAPTSVELWRKASRSKPAIYRLRFTRPRRPAVYAKRSVTSDLALERSVYQEILPRLPLTVPRYMGSCRDEEGATWLFVEDVGNRRLVETRRDHRMLAASWLARLHRSAADDAAIARLPDRGPARYLCHLRAGRERIHRNFDNPALTADDRQILCRLLEQLDRIEASWPEIEQVCAVLPVTMVHGDFRPKNVRLGMVEDSPVLYPLDWEMAGRGVPAADLASAFGHVMTVSIDPGTYLEAVRERWPDLNDAALRRLARVGRIFQAVAGTEWAGASLIFESPLHLLKPIGSMRTYREIIAEAFAAGPEGPEWS